MEYIWTSVSTQHLLVAVVEALQSYSITPNTATSGAAAKIENSADDETSDGQANPSTGVSSHSSHEEANNCRDGHSGRQPTFRVPKVAGIKRAGETHSSDRVKKIILTRLVKKEKETSSEDEGTNPEQTEGTDGYRDGRRDFTQSPEKRVKMYKMIVESLKAEIAEESRPLTGWMSMWEGFITYGEELVAIYTHAMERTQLESEIALNAARIRHMEALSVEMLESLIAEEDGDMIARAIIHKKRTEKS